MNLLHTAARYALELQSKSKQEYYLVAMGMRRDGAIVRATNKAMRGGSSLPCPLSHAEVRLCRKLDAGVDVYVARVNRLGEWAMSRPCARCQVALRTYRVRRVYYTIRPNEYGVLDWG